MSKLLLNLDRREMLIAPRPWLLLNLDRREMSIAPRPWHFAGTRWWSYSIEEACHSIQKKCPKKGRNVLLDCNYYNGDFRGSYFRIESHLLIICTDVHISVCVCVCVCVCVFKQINNVNNLMSDDLKTFWTAKGSWWGRDETPKSHVQGGFLTTTHASSSVAQVKHKVWKFSELVYLD